MTTNYPNYIPLEGSASVLAVDDHQFAMQAAVGEEPSLEQVTGDEQPPAVKMPGWAKGGEEPPLSMPGTDDLDVASLLCVCAAPHRQAATAISVPGRHTPRGPCDVG